MIGDGELAKLMQGAEQQAFKVEVAAAQWPLEQFAEQKAERSMVTADPRSRSPAAGPIRACRDVA